MAAGAVVLGYYLTFWAGVWRCIRGHTRKRRGSALILDGCGGMGGMPSLRPFWIVRNPATGELRRVASASVEDGMSVPVLTSGTSQATADFPEAAGIRTVTAKRGKAASKPKKKVAPGRQRAKRSAS